MRYPTLAFGAARRRRAPPTLVHRHSGITRLWHWVNALCLAVLLMSGLQIFNAHPALYWGQDSTFDAPALSIRAERDADGEWRGITRIGALRLDTTGVLGLSGPREARQRRAFPAWATLPGPRSLARGRDWHFLAGWVFAPGLLAYLTYLVLGGGLRRRLLPRRHEWRRLGHTLIDHLRLRFPRGEAARHYNLPQKLAYLLVLFVIAPLAVLSGLTMSPTLDAAWPWLLDLFGGRQSARSVHFLCALALVGFFVIHVILVLVSGVTNNLRAMITGRYALPPEEDPRDE
ncbi:cytochrome b/b6 domain-containing protein [Halomonas ramblicola]|uniref:cytochrome b/b6 domain-containing protein n=1 Tax=Halomonas ramblicola TaxID=747349 RepID=UPI0025B3009A|nr:cytochrome b/b6 domain-containing protein [Halomonas ramblicola]MDN3520677.1 cytochrome b/b6 domain-containing protein [Halomonas ramblicola]